MCSDPKGSFSIQKMLCANFNLESHTFFFFRSSLVNIFNALRSYTFYFISVVDCVALSVSINWERMRSFIISILWTIVWEFRDLHSTSTVCVCVCFKCNECIAWCNVSIKWDPNTIWAEVQINVHAINSFTVNSCNTLKQSSILV